MDLHDRQKRSEAGGEAPAQKPVERAHASAAQLAAECKGDPARFATLVKQLPAAQVPDVIAAAQRLYGNSFVREALDPSTAKHTDVTAGHTGSPNHAGVHGLDGGAPDLFAEQQDAKQAKAAETPRVFGAELEGRYGETFGAGRMSGGESTHMGGQYNKWGGDGMPGFTNHEGEAGMAPGSIDLGTLMGTTTPQTPGGPVAVPYPNVSGSEPKSETTAPDKTGGKPGGKTGGRTNGDEAGTTAGVASSSVAGQAQSVSANNQVIVEGKPVSPATSTPREDQDGGGSGAPVVLNRADAGLVAGGLHRELAGQVGQAGGKGDGAGDTGNVAGSSATSGMVASQRDKVGGRDLPHDSGGNLDLDAALKINGQVNPTRG